MRKIRVAPSILSADFAAMGEAVERLERAGLEVYTHSRVSTNDEGLSLGQLKILEARYVLGGTAEDR